MIEEPKPSVVPAAVAAPQAIPAIVDPAKTTDAVVLSQAPVIAASDAKPVVDKPSSVIAPTIDVTK